jgi:hypothetical protein
MRTRTRLTILSAALAATGIAAPAASAAPTVTDATGTNAAAIQGAVDSFRNQLGTANGGGPPAADGRRQIVWDGAPDGRAAPSFMPENNFRNVGAVFSTPGLGFELSADDNDDNGAADADPDQVEFTDINPTYDDALAPFSPERLFAPIGSNVTETRFVVPGSNTAAQTNGFGVVFSDVDQAGPTRIELLDAAGASLGVWPVPATAGDETFSFVGVVLDPGVAAARAVITTGNAPFGDPDVSQGGGADIVAMDDFVYGEPKAIPPVPEVEPDTEAPELKVKGVGKEIEISDLAKGLKAKVATDETAAIDASLTAAARKVEFSKGKAKVLLAEKSAAAASGNRQLKLKPKRSLLRGVDRLKLELRVVATDEAGNRTTVKRKLTAS